MPHLADFFSRRSPIRELTLDTPSKLFSASAGSTNQVQRIRCLAREQGDVCDARSTRRLRGRFSRGAIMFCA